MRLFHLREKIRKRRKGESVRENEVCGQKSGTSFEIWGENREGKIFAGMPWGATAAEGEGKGGGGGHCVTAQLTVQQQQQHCLVLRLFLSFSSLFFAGKHIMKKDLAESGQV